MRRICLRLIMMVTALAAVARAQQPPPAPAVPDTAGPELAARFADLAQLVLRQNVIVRPHWEMAGALLEGAARLDPANSRYPRMEVQTMLHIGDYDRARDAIHRYCLLEPQDTAAQAQWIDLYNLHLPSADVRLSYLRPLLAQASLAPEVRAHAAVRAAEVCIDRADNQQALAYVDAALKLNPLDMGALRIKYSLIAGQISPAQRVQLLLDMLRVNPAAPAVIARIAGELADAGLVKESVDMYRAGLAVSNRLAQPLSHDFALGYAEELFIAANVEGTQKLVNALLSVDPGDPEALTMRVLLCRAAGPTAQDQLDKAVQQLLMAQYNQIQKLRQQLGDATATTQDVTAGLPISWPDFQGDVAPLQQPDRRAVRGQYARVLTALAWTQIYFARKPDDAAAMLDALKALSPADSTDLARLEGWSLLVRGQTPEARVKLSAVAARDPLAALGMLRLDAGAATAAADAQELFRSYPSGLLGAVLWDGLRDFRIEAMPRHDAELMRRAYDAFPMEWLKILDTPQSFYAIHASPLKVPYKFAEPILAQVTLQNITDYDIPVGEDAILHPDLWFDAHIQDVTQAQEVPGCVYERLGQCLVLHAHSSVTQTVRMDQALLARALAAEPAPELEITFTVRTNPSTLPGGNGPGGYVAAFSQAAQREPFATTEESLLALVQSLPAATSVDKLRDVDLINDVIGLLLNGANAQQYHTVAQQLFDAMRGLRDDPSGAVRGWVAYVTINRISQEARAPLVDHMLADPLWTTRALGILIAAERPPDEQQKIVDRVLATEQDPTAQHLALALRDLAQLGAAPATAPAQPATAPTEPITAPMEPATAPMEPATAATQPSTAPIEPATAPMQPTTAATEPATAPTQPATAPIEPATAPAQPTTAATQPTTVP